MLRSSLLRNSVTRKGFATINTGTIVKTKSHKFRNRFLVLSLSVISLYGGGIILSETNSKYADIYIDNIPFADDILDYYKGVKAGNAKLPSISWDNIKSKYSSYITGSTLGIPVHRPKNDKEAKLLQLKLLDNSKLKDLDPRFNIILHELRATVDTLNNQQIPLTNFQTEVITNRFNDLYEIIFKFNEKLSENINESIINGTKDRINQFENNYQEKIVTKEKQLEDKYKEKFENFKSGLEENVTKLLEISLEANQEKMRAKQANEITLLSITQVQEFNKIIEEKVEKERNAKLSNLKALDERIANFTKTMNKLGDILTKNQVITRLSLMVNDMKNRFDFNDSYSFEINGEINRMKALSKALQKNGCACSSGNCKCKKCSCSMKDKKNNEKLLDVTINELETLTKDGPILSNEQLFNRWNLLESDFKTASLLPPNAGILGHITAKFFSFFLFSKKGISTSSDDLDALFARVQTNLEMSKLDNAIEDVVSLNGWPRVLCEQWIKDARRKLEVESLINVLDAELKVL